VGLLLPSSFEASCFMPAPAHVSIADMDPGESAASPSLNSGPCWPYTGECGGAADPNIAP
jgi:hypothetical protein